MIGIASSPSKPILTFFYVNKPSVLGEHLLPWVMTLKYSSPSPWKLNMITWLLSGQWILSRRGVFNFWKEFFKDRNVSFSSSLSSCRRHCWNLSSHQRWRPSVGNGTGTRGKEPRSQLQEGLFRPATTHLRASFTKEKWAFTHCYFGFPLLKLSLILNDINFRTKKQNKILLKFQWKAH